MKTTEQQRHAEKKHGVGCAGGKKAGYVHGCGGALRIIVCCCMVVRFGMSRKASAIAEASGSRDDPRRLAVILAEFRGGFVGDER